MPFITEEIYHLLKDRNDDLCVKQWKGFVEADDAILQQGLLLQQLITGVRDAKNKNGLKPREAVSLFIQTGERHAYERFINILQKQTSAERMVYINEPVANAVVISVEKDKIYMQANVSIDKQSIKDEIEKDLEYQRSFLSSVMKKLSNERFVQNAKPEVVALEQKKQSDAEARIQSLEQSLANL